MIKTVIESLSFVIFGNVVEGSSKSISFGITWFIAGLILIGGEYIARHNNIMDTKSVFFSVLMTIFMLSFECFYLSLYQYFFPNNKHWKGYDPSKQITLCGNRIGLSLSVLWIILITIFYKKIHPLFLEN